MLSMEYVWSMYGVRHNPPRLPSAFTSPVEGELLRDRNVHYSRNIH
jgi:hypothetical protein